MQVVEETVNRDTKTPGGTTGFSLRPAALAKYFLSAEYRSTSVRMMRELTHMSSSKVQHPDMEAWRIKRDEADVTSCVSLLTETWINPFDSSQVSICRMRLHLIRM